MDRYRCTAHAYTYINNRYHHAAHAPLRLWYHLRCTLRQYGQPHANDTLQGDTSSVSYASVYPLGMFVRVIIAQIIIMFFV